MLLKNHLHRGHFFLPIPSSFARPVSSLVIIITGLYVCATRIFCPAFHSSLLHSRRRLLLRCLPLIPLLRLLLRYRPFHLLPLWLRCRSFITLLLLWSTVLLIVPSVHPVFILPSARIIVFICLRSRICFSCRSSVFNNRRRCIIIPV